VTKKKGTSVPHETEMLTYRVCRQVKGTVILGCPYSSAVIAIEYTKNRTRGGGGTGKSLCQGRVIIAALQLEGKSVIRPPNSLQDEHGRGGGWRKNSTRDTGGVIIPESHLMRTPANVI